MGCTVAFKGDMINYIFLDFLGIKHTCHVIKIYFTCNEQYHTQNILISVDGCRRLIFYYRQSKMSAILNILAEMYQNFCI